MSWRVVEITTRAKLDLKMNYLVVRKEEVTKIHLSEISTLIIESTAVSVTAALLVELAKRKIKVIFCDEKRNPLFENVSYYGCHDTSLKIKLQIQWDENIKGFIWTEIVREKINNQKKFLIEIGKAEYELLDKYINNLEFKDASNREGHAAKVYFNALFGKDFSRSQDNVINACLDYGYGIILSSFNREITASGYLTQLGLFHDNRFNMFNFGSDLMEPFRILVDRLVYFMNPNKFDTNEKIRLVNLLNSEVTIDGKRQYLNNAIRIYCKSIFDALNEKDVSLMRFYI
ncbi:MAG: type II CRISPR-associated endonuclease Cas1 [Tissierellia bacterium]|nr:type II CRISPR-associated endonuclease Cas1 [Tissierellia bacterium]